MRTEKRSTDVNDQRNWALDCGFDGCGERFASTQIVGDVSEHWNRHVGGKYAHGTKKAEADKPNLNLVWIGVGQPPKGKPSFIA